MHLICTRMLATHPCAIPLTHNPRRYKWPSLEESYSILVAPGRQGSPAPLQAHDARGDVERCRDVFLCLLRT